jgi:predicted transposase/invertase (TIGR01784 family)
MLYSSDCRSIRLDVYASDEAGYEYNLEMQNENEGNLPKRSRFHQAEMDVMSIKPGEDFDRLPPGYVIFICSFDPFGQGLYRYTFQNMCQETPFPLEDGAIKIFLSTKGKNEDDVPEGLKNFLHYVENSTDSYVASVQDKTISKLHESIRQIKKSREWEGRYVRFEELLRKSERKGREEGLEKGRAEAQTQLFALIDCMTQAGESAEIPRLTKEPEYLQSMLEKYHL